MAKNQMQRRPADDGEYGDLPARGQGGGQMTKHTRESMGHFLAKGRNQFAAALPRHMTAERLMRIALTACAKTPKLLECRQETFALALLNAAALGLEPNGRDGHLVPYKGVVQFIPDYKGLIQLAFRSGQVAGITAKVVYEKDHFKYELGTNEYLEHKPSEDLDPGKMTHAWAMCRFKDGSTPKFVVLNARDIGKRRASSQYTGAGSMWDKHTESMWAKSAVRELAKWIPQVAELATAVELENSAERGELQLRDDTGGMGDIFGAGYDDPTPETKSDALANRLAGDTIDEQPETPQNALSEGTRLIEAMRNAPSAVGFALAWKACQAYSGWTDAENVLADQVYEERGNYWAGVEAAAKRKAEQGSLIDKGSPEYE